MKRTPEWIFEIIVYIIFAFVGALAWFVMYKSCKYQQAVNEAAVAVERRHKEIEALNAALDAREEALDAALQQLKQQGNQSP